LLPCTKIDFVVVKDLQLALIKLILEQELALIKLIQEQKLELIIDFTS
jgi:hypothetical protein